MRLEPDERFEIAAKQYSYLLTNKVLFYEVVREKTKARYDPQAGDTITPIETKSGFELDPLADYTTIENLENHLNNQFETIVEEIDYEPIFNHGASLFAEFPQNTKTLRTLDDFISNIESESITKLDEDFLGAVYEELIPVQERKELGQFYTHPKIAETISRWAIRDVDTEENGNSQPPRVLDPASGSGTFVVEAYNTIERLMDSVEHQTIVDHLTAIDINRFPLHLTALNLSARSISKKTERLYAYNDSFFDIDPETDRFRDGRIEGTQNDLNEVGHFDAAVGNPPYIQQANLYPNKDHFRNHLSTFGRSGTSPYKDGNKKLSGRSDAYIYFVTHATQFLRDGGRLGYIMPTKWLMTRYGESFQEFLYDHYKVNAVVGFSVRAFEDALVDTALLLIEKCEDEQERRDNTVNFVQIRESMEPEDIISTVDFDYPIDEDEYMVVRNRNSYRTVAVEQSYLTDEGGQKLNYYLSAPVEFIKLLENEKLVPLDDLADVTYGKKTGANDFFFISDDDLETWSIDERFLKPAIKSIKEADEQVLSEEDTGKYLFDMYEFVEEVKRDTTGVAANSDLRQRVKDALERGGYTTTKQYIEWGESEEFHTRRSCEGRDAWFNLGQLDGPEILHPKFFNERVFAIWNRDRLMPSNAIDCINLDDDVDETVVMGILNSTVHKALLECWGRAEGGGALQLMTYELSSLPVLDVRGLAGEVTGKIADANQALIDGEDDAQERLDQIILDALDVDIDTERLQELQETMMQKRVSSGAEVEVLVEHMEGLEEGGTQAFVKNPDGNQSLSDYMS
ncbi:HsdM family class I SAM-dependent methyltransferase [Halococcus sp. AFM35]|uniref:HsdM family class I SAM-dependent methyltransferase n=1 Tax=Halococcus sp. AFM35 TaxID=3421653 RepID=UPI003EBBDD0B